MPNLNRVNHKDLVVQLEKYWHGKESLNLKTYRGEPAMRLEGFASKGNPDKHVNLQRRQIWL